MPPEECVGGAIQSCHRHHEWQADLRLTKSGYEANAFSVIMKGVCACWQLGFMLESQPFHLLCLNSTI
jgi:hypothetical protein